MSTTAACRSCEAEVRWARTPKGKPIPLDAEPTVDGNVRLDGGTAIVLSKADAQLMRDRGVQLFTSHFVTCPQRDQWRRPA